MKFTTRIIPIPPTAALDAASDALSLSKGAAVPRRQIIPPILPLQPMPPIPRLDAAVLETIKRALSREPAERSNGGLLA